MVLMGTTDVFQIGSVSWCVKFWQRPPSSAFGAIVYQKSPVDSRCGCFKDVFLPAAGVGRLMWLVIRFIVHN